jgi:hypothetical protein
MKGGRLSLFIGLSQKKMKLRIIMAFLVLMLLVTGIGQAQLISPTPISASPQLPVEILTGLIGKYLAMVQQYQMMANQGQNPETAVKLRISASIDVSNSGLDEDPDLGPLLADVTNMVFWVNANVFSRYPSTFAVDFSGIFGNVKILSKSDGSIIVADDESVFSSLPGESIDYVLNQIGLPTDLPLSDQELQELALSILPNLAIFGTQYEGLKSTPRGMAHVVKFAPIDDDMIITLWVLDKTWDLCKVDFFDTQSNISATIIINQIDLVLSVPGSEFVVDTANLTKISYDDMIQLLSMKVVTAGLMDIPVVADLYTSSYTLSQGEKVEVTSNALDAKDAESELVPLIEYKAPNGTWTSLKAEYFGEPPLGSWKAIFTTTLADTPGVYDLRVSYTNKAGNTSETFELSGAFNVIAVPPNIMSFTPSLKEKDILVSSPITASFSQEMNKASVESSFSLTDPSGKNVPGSFVWSNNSFVFKPNDNLKYGIDYAVKIAGTSMSVNNVTLDANMNGLGEGSPKDDFVWTFTTETFPSLVVELKPANKSIIKGNMVVADLVAKDVSKLGGFSFDVNFDPTILNVINVNQASFANWRPRTKEIGESDIWLPVIVDNTKGKVTLAASKTRDVGIGGTGVLATITFETIGVGESNIDFQNVSLKNILGETMAFALLDARLAVVDFDLFDVNKDGVVDILDFISTRPDGKSDVNGDGIVDILDVVALMNHEEEIKLWDINGDGIVDINDFIKIEIANGINPDVNGDGVVDILDIVSILNGAKGAPISRLVNELGVSFPNPTNPEAWIPFKLAESNSVVIKLYNTKGQLVRTLDLGYRVPGSYITKNMAAYWDGKDENGQHVSSGIYFYNIKAGSFTATKKLIVLE